MKHVALCVAVMLLFAAPAWADPEAGQKKGPQTIERRVADLEREVAGLKRELGYLKMPGLPEELSLCGRPIPLGNEDVREDFEREFYQFIENKGLLTILIKRYGKFFSVVSEELNRANMPSDLIYLAMAESYLNPRAISKANAGGIWQFVKDTGKREGLCVTDQIDERYSIARSTRSALLYLRSLHDEFGDWFVAMAAYNAGEGRLREAISNQNTRDFFQLFLPEETGRYIYRIAAIKEIVENAGQYGLVIEKSDYYRPYAVVEVTIELEKETHTAVLAQAMDLPYKIFREYNLHIRKYRLPRGIYHLYVPVEKKEAFFRGIKLCPGVTVQTEE
jgi:membrane-bound lytic murein transglycosylase D